MKTLRFVTLQAKNTVPLSATLAEYLTVVGPIPVRYERVDDWRSAYELVAQGKIDIAWICGWPYVQFAMQADPKIELLAAPVMAEERYGDQPVYFSDVVVRADRPYETFDDLRGQRWAINEPGSQSGHHIVRYKLALMNATETFFSSVLITGSHSASLQAVLSGEVDGSAIDSTLLTWLVAEKPALAEEVRIIDVLGPSPIPPLVAASHLDAEVKHALRQDLLGLLTTKVGRAILQLGGLRRFARVTNADYTPIRKMSEAAVAVPALSIEIGDAG